MVMESLRSNSRSSRQKEWIIVQAKRNESDNKELSVCKTGAMLLFNEAVPACAGNRATCVDPPTSIVIEKLLPVAEEHSPHDSTKSSFSFTALSEECLNAAVKLAKRDLRRSRLSPLKKSPTIHNQAATLMAMSDVDLLQEMEASQSKVTLKTSSPKEPVAKPRHRLEHTSCNQPNTSQSHFGHSPLPSEYCLQKNNTLVNEIHRLQKELEVCLQKAEEQISKEQILLEPLEPDEQHKLNIRKQKQEARSASIIYALKQQVNEVQENLQHGLSQKTKSTALQRLAAAHRGVLRAFHGFMQQLGDSAHCKNPPNFKDLGQLIRQLCLCLVQVEVNKGSPAPQSALSILQKLETLNSAISKQATLKKMQVPTCPPPRESQQGVTAFAHQAARKPINAAKNIKGKKKTSRKPKSVSYALTNRRDVLRVCVGRLAQQRELGGKHPLQNHTWTKTGDHAKKGAPLIKHGQAHSSFLQPTVSSQLRVNQRSQKEQSVPWIPTSPRSPPRQRPLPPKSRSEPRCLCPSEKSPQRQPSAKGTQEAMPSLNSEKKQLAHEEAMRIVWLDKMTKQRLKELEQLTVEEKEHLHILRSKVISPLQSANGPEPNAMDIIQPHLDQSDQFDASVKTTAHSLNNRLFEHVADEQSAKSAEQLNEALLDDLSEDAAQVAWTLEADQQLGNNAQHLMQTSTLESMLLRMDEIQRDQEQVRRRVTSIIYADPLNWNKLQDSGKESNSGPCSPQPIRLTKPLLRQSPAAEIILKKPLETGVLSEPRQTEADVSQAEDMLSVVAQRSKGAVLSVPSHTLRSIQQYRENHEDFCRSVALKTPGGVSPWATADSLAEELLAEALAVVAAEFQDVVEEYAEAVFTSEFLQPVQSPTPSAQAIT